jgi:hypothetical protein
VETINIKYGFHDSGFCGFLNFVAEFQSKFPRLKPNPWRESLTVHGLLLNYGSTELGSVNLKGLNSDSPMFYFNCQTAMRVDRMYGPDMLLLSAHERGASSHSGRGQNPDVLSGTLPVEASCARQCHRPEPSCTQSKLLRILAG